MVSHIRINVFSLEGNFLLGETHEISFGGEGLLAVADRFGYKAENFLCFRSKEQALDVSNMGAPLSSVCSIFRPDMGTQIADTLQKAGYSIISEEEGEWRNFGFARTTKHDLLSRFWRLLWAKLTFPMTLRRHMPLAHTCILTSNNA